MNQLLICHKRFGLPLFCHYMISPHMKRDSRRSLFGLQSSQVSATRSLISAYTKPKQMSTKRLIFFKFCFNISHLYFILSLYTLYIFAFNCLANNPKRFTLPFCDKFPCLIATLFRFIFRFVSYLTCPSLNCFIISLVRLNSPGCSSICSRCTHSAYFNSSASMVMVSSPSTSQ